VKATETEVFINGCNSCVEAHLGETLLSCMRRAGILVESTCDSRGICGRCRVTARGALTKPDESESAHLIGLPPDTRLACTAKVMGPVHVTLNDEWTRLSSVFGLNEGRVPVDSSIKRMALPEIEPRSSRPYMETLPFQVTDPRVLDQIATWDHKTVAASGVIFEDEVLDIRFGQEPLLGAAVDLGTTSLALYVFNLETGDLIGRSSALNPQTAYGGDVITRINYCRQTSQGTGILAEIVMKELGAMLDEALGPHHARDQVYLVTVAGNTTMLHILAGVQPLSLALAPFRPTFLNPIVLPGERFGMPIHPCGRCILLPGASAYVGADIVAGLIAINYGSRTGATLFIDIGTNGEIVLIEGPDRLLGTSCAVGPALEGMNITCGCRAVPGAVDSFMLDSDLLPHFTTIAGRPAEGICGSGLIDLTAALVTSGLINPGGAFNLNAEEPLAARMKGDRYYLTDNIFLTQRDVRQVQLAKSAVVSGILTLLEEAGRSVEDVEEIIIAGSFGYHLNADNLRLIGLLPKAFGGKVSFVGNSCLSGASMALLNRDALLDMSTIAGNVTVVELGSHPAFRSHFISSLHF
jgi:uncharacterized 2Fe-2S/4Fe-4S cluster protein (DUF4445 family)